MSRIKLPNRRPNVTLKIKHKGMTFYVTLGIDAESGRIMEVFGNARQATTDIDYMIADACVAISIALQHGAKTDELLHSMHFVPVVGNPEVTREPASLMGKIIAAILEEEAKNEDE